MTLEAQPNNPKPEGISPQHQERFSQLEAELVSRIQGDRHEIIFSTNSDDPTDGLTVELDRRGEWSLGFGRMAPNKTLNDSGEPVELVELLKKYVYFQNSLSLTIVLRTNLQEYKDKVKELERSVEQNPAPFAESFLGQMENAREQLSRQENTT